MFPNYLKFSKLGIRTNTETLRDFCLRWRLVLAARFLISDLASLVLVLAAQQRAQRLGA
jgi:hypothetical protein